MDVPARYRTVLFKIDNSSGLLEPGTFYQVKISGTDRRRVLAVPLEALMGDKELFVYIVGTDGRLKAQPVRKGMQDDEYAEIVSGLNEGDTVVVVGKEGGLAPGMKVQVTLELPDSKAR